MTDARCMAGSETAQSGATNQTVWLFYYRPYLYVHSEILLMADPGHKYLQSLNSVALKARHGPKGGYIKPCLAAENETNCNMAQEAALLRKRVVIVPITQNNTNKCESFASLDTAAVVLSLGHNRLISNHAFMSCNRGT